MPNPFVLLLRSFQVFVTHPVTIISIALVNVPGLLFRFVHVGVPNVVTLIAALALGLAVNGALIRAAATSTGAERTGFIDSYRVALIAYWRLVGFNLRILGAAFLLGITIVGIPFAVRLVVRWWFGSEAVIIAGTSAKDAISLSCQIATGRWWPLASLVLISLGLSRLPFIPVWLLFDPSQFAQGLMISMWAFTITPLVTIFWALMFLDLADRVTSKDPG